MSMETIHLDIKGMHCSACSNRIEKVVSRIDVVTSVVVNLSLETGRITFNKKRTSTASIIERINQLGFEASKQTNKRQDNYKGTEIKTLQWNFMFSTILTIPLAWAMLIHFRWAAFIYIPPHIY